MSVFGIGARNQNEKPGLVTNGAVLLLDAADPRSYTSGSSTWNDLSGFGNNATFSGSMNLYWNSTFGGYFDFPNNYNVYATVAQASSINNITLGDFTIECWWTVDAAAGGAEDNVGWFGKTNWSTNPGIAVLSGRDTGTAFAGTCDFIINAGGFRPANSQLTNQTKVFWPDSSTGFATNTWSCTQFVRTGTILSVYSNLRFLWSNTCASFVSNTNNLIIGRPRSDNATFGYEMDGKMMVLAWYNRALNAAERAQNYNVMASRVGRANIGI